RTRQMHGEADYAKMWVSLYESFVRHGDIMLGAGYPVMVNGRYIMASSPIPRWDIPNFHQAETLYLFGAGREKRLYAIPPHTTVVPLEFEDVRFHIEDFNGESCHETGYRKAFLDEIFSDDGSKQFLVNDSNFLDKLRQGAPISPFTNPYLQQIRS
ncbi:MAG TPA: alpha-D-ribose 1-methylphosphonate 5-phosphate C-P-lyase PhnJ, partial [Puia sp.]|nr:alpha-D-ribose 1-methylphosphonate 5-phosphate C-P-lyase PhnJ [Puia sp.]